MYWKLSGCGHQKIAKYLSGEVVEFPCDNAMHARGNLRWVCPVVLTATMGHSLVEVTTKKLINHLHEADIMIYQYTYNYNL